MKTMEKFRAQSGVVELERGGDKTRLSRYSKFLLPAFFLLLSVACEDRLMLNDSTSSSSPNVSTSNTTMSSSSALPKANLTELTMPTNVSYELTTYDCSNNPGPQIYFSGLAGTAGFGVRTIFRNNWDGTHAYTADASVDVALQPSGSQITIPKQPVLGGVGGNPYIWIQFIDENGAPMSDEIFIGRCVQGYTFKGAQSVAERAVASSKYEVSGCDNNNGPTVNFDAGLLMKGLKAVVIFSNSDNPVGGPHEASAVLSRPLDVIPTGTAFSFPKQPVLGGVGGNPWIWTQFLDGKASAVSNEILLGRCVQINQSLN